MERSDIQRSKSMENKFDKSIERSDIQRSSFSCEAELKNNLKFAAASIQSHENPYPKSRKSRNPIYLYIMVYIYIYINIFMVPNWHFGI
jgi:hypothetical protein